MNAIPNYRDFLARKAQIGGDHGFAPTFMPDFLFDFQVSLVEWAVAKGRAAIFADCGMGKTPMQLVWAQNIVKHENKPVLILAPLSVSQQTVEEAAKFEIDAVRIMDGAAAGNRVVVTNYERLHYFDPTDFAGVVCDESSIIKNFDGARKGAITEFMRKTKFRLLCTATAAPNDYIELGTSSEALGYLGFMDMLSTFFKNDKNSLHPAFIGSEWRLKGHAELRFWQWMASWARACRRPSDMGFDDRDFILPALIESEQAVPSPVPFGELFHVPAEGLAEEREDARSTVRQRCELAAVLHQQAGPGIAWCNLNAEGDLLERLIPGSVQVSGADPDERKEEVFTAFRRGHITKLITKPKIAAFGMNWQHCAHMTEFPTHSFEQYYQLVRRCWRFGQKNAVRVDSVTTTAQAGVLANRNRKAKACDEMFDRLVEQMNNAIRMDRLKTFDKQELVPSWL